jgi:hypothetical protein
VIRSALAALVLPAAVVSITGSADGQRDPQAVVEPGGVRTALGEARSKLLLPNLTPLRATAMYVQRDHHVRRLRFEAGLANIGPGPMEVRPNRAKPCPKGKRHASQILYRDVDGSGHFKRSVDTRFIHRSSGCMVFHPEHNHWHFEAASRYRLYRPSAADDILVRARKMSFCLRDSERVPANFGDFHYALYYRDCGRDTPQGISIGWVDVYANYLTGQSLTLPRRLRHGMFCLNIRVDPRDELREGDETDNNSYRAFRLHGQKVTLVERNRICKPG